MLSNETKNKVQLEKEKYIKKNKDQVSYKKNK